MPVSLTRPRASRLQQLAQRLRQEPFTYEDVGATRDPASLPNRYRHDHRVVEIGTDGDAFDVGRQALRRWEAHRALGATLTPENPPIEEGQVVIATLSLGPLTVVIPCRIVYVTDTADSFGFAYGTLRGHPETGEESFHIVRRLDGQVTFEISTFSRPAGVMARLGAPVARRVQVRATDAYLRGVGNYVAAHTEEAGP